MNSTDPVCFARDVDGDLEFPLRLATGLEAVAIGIGCRLRLIRGEMFTDLDVGVPYLTTDSIPEGQEILGQPFDPVKTRAAILAAILRTPAVLDVPFLRLSFDRPARNLAIFWRARTSFGDTETVTTTL